MSQVSAVVSSVGRMRKVSIGAAAIRFYHLSKDLSRLELFSDLGIDHSCWLSLDCNTCQSRSIVSACANGIWRQINTLIWRQLAWCAWCIMHFGMTIQRAVPRRADLETRRARACADTLHKQSCNASVYKANLYLNGVRVEMFDSCKRGSLGFCKNIFHTAADLMSHIAYWKGFWTNSPAYNWVIHITEAFNAFADHAQIK